MDKNWIIIIALLLVIIALLAGLVFMMSNNGNAESKLTISCNSTVEIGDSIEFKLTDANGNPISNENISITITNAENTDSYYSVATDENGIGVLKLDKSPGKYDVNATFNGNGKYAKSGDSKTITIEEEASASEPASSESSGSTSSVSSDSGSSQSVREEDKVTSDGWNPKEHEVSREPLEDGNERVTYDDGYSRVVDKDGNILSYGY